MTQENLIAQARAHAGMTQVELALAAKTSRTTLSSYEHGHKSPALETANRIIESAGFRMTITPKITFTEINLSNGKPSVIPNTLPRLTPGLAFATIRLPIHINWSKPEQTFNLGIRRERARAYEKVLREGTPNDLTTYIDGALLVDIWPELVLPKKLRQAWGPVIQKALEPQAA